MYCLVSTTDIQNGQSLPVSGNTRSLDNSTSKDAFGVEIRAWEEPQGWLLIIFTFSRSAIPPCNFIDRPDF